MRCRACKFKIQDDDPVIEIRKARIQDGRVVTDRMFPDHAEWAHFDCVRNIDDH